MKYEHVTRTHVICIRQVTYSHTHIKTKHSCIIHMYLQ